MKKFLSVILVVFLLVLMSGCVPNVEYINNWSFQYSLGTDDYSLFFGLLDKNQKEIATEAKVDIRIVNDFDETVYEDELDVTEEDFSYFTNADNEEFYLAKAIIDKDLLKPGKSRNGTVYFTVYNDDHFGFDELQCVAFECLPILDHYLSIAEETSEISIPDYLGNTITKIRIDDLELEPDSYGTAVEIVLKGEKTFEKKSMYSIPMDMFGYRILDSQGYVVTTGLTYLQNLHQGDKFMSDPILIYDLIPGEEYTIEFSGETY